MAYKITAARLLKFAKDLGLDVEVVDDEAEMDFDEKLGYDAVDKAREVMIKPRVQAQIENELKTKHAGMYGLKLRTMLKNATGLTMKQLEEVKDDEEVFKLAMKAIEDKWGGDAKEMNRKLEEISALKDKEKADERAALEQEIQSWQHKYKSRDIVDHSVKSLGKIKIPETADRNHLGRLFYEDLAKRFDLDLEDDNGKQVVKIYQKGTKNAAFNKAGTNPFDWDEAAQDFIKPYGYNTNDGRDDNPIDKMSRNPMYGNPNNPQQGARKPLGKEAPKNAQEAAQAIIDRNMAKAQA
jgi:hypothetical protein